MQEKPLVGENLPCPRKVLGLCMGIKLFSETRFCSKYCLTNMFNVVEKYRIMIVSVEVIKITFSSSQEQGHAGRWAWTLVLKSIYHPFLISGSVLEKTKVEHKALFFTISYIPMVLNQSQQMTVASGISSQGWRNGKVSSTALMWTWVSQQCSALRQSLEVVWGEEEGGVQSRRGKMDDLVADPFFVHLSGTTSFATQVIKFLTSSYFDSGIIKLRREWRNTSRSVKIM